MAGKTEYKNKWQKENVDRINLTIPKGKKDIIKAHADKQGESVNGFINRLINYDLISGAKQENKEFAVRYCQSNDEYEKLFWMYKIVNNVINCCSDNEIIENFKGFPLQKIISVYEPIFYIEGEDTSLIDATKALWDIKTFDRFSAYMSSISSELKTKLLEYFNKFKTENMIAYIQQLNLEDNQ